MEKDALQLDEHRILEEPYYLSTGSDMDTSRHQMVSAKFQIRGVPTLIFFKNGQVVDQVVGAVSEQELDQRLNTLL